MPCARFWNECVAAITHRLASPSRTVEAVRDGSDAVSDWPLLNALRNIASPAWVGLHHLGGVMRYTDAGHAIAIDCAREGVAVADGRA